MPSEEEKSTNNINVESSIENGVVIIIFLIDTTASMRTFCEAMPSTLIQCINTIKLLFPNVIIKFYKYTDYCLIKNNESVVISCESDSNNKLINFAKNLNVSPIGNDSPEAVKTALNIIINDLKNNSLSNRTLILHYTDAGYHTNNQTGSGKHNLAAEKEALKEFNPGFDACDIVRSLDNLGITVITFMPPIKDFSNKIRIMAYKTMITLGNVVYLPNTYITTITEHTMGVLLQMMGQPFEKINIFPRLNISKFESEISDEFRINVGKIELKCNFQNIDIHPAFYVKNIKDIEKQFFQNENFRNEVYESFSELFNRNLIDCLLYNSVLGRLWRALCRRREDPRSQELCNTITQCMHSLPTSQQENLKKFIEDSFNQEDEIYRIIFNTNYDDEISTFDPLIEGFFVIDRISNLPTSKDIKSLLNAPIPEALSKVQHFLSGLQFVRQGPLPFNGKKPIYIPLGIKNKDFFSILMHLIHPGLLLSLRPAAIVAILAYLSGHPILKPKAEKFLNDIKGKHIPPIEKYKDYPIILDHNLVKLIIKVTQFLTDDEKKLYEYLNKIIRLKEAKKLLISIDTSYSPNLKIKSLDHRNLCFGCNYYRSDTLMKDDLCGLCIVGTEKDIIPDCDNSLDHSFLVECRSCTAIYSVVNLSQLNISPKCHYCRNQQDPEIVQCIKCKNKFCCPTEKLRKDQYTCKRCQVKPSESIEISKIKLIDLIDSNPELINYFHLKNHTAIFNSSSLFNLWENYGNLEQNTLIPYEKLIMYNKKQINDNLDNFIIKLTSSVFNSSLLQTCSMCYEEMPLSNLQSPCGQCENLTCTTCLKHWYGNANPGKLYVPASGLCAFCKRVPKASCIKLYNKLASRLQGRKNQNYLHNMYYAWCIRCQKIKELAPKECSEDAPNISNFECEECKLAITTLDEISLDQATKKCPSCSVKTFRISGCWHMSCPKPCNAHWCWKCGENFTYSTIYDHMNKEHGSIGIGDYDNNSDDE